MEKCARCGRVPTKIENNNHPPVITCAYCATLWYSTESWDIRQKQLINKFLENRVQDLKINFPKLTPHECKQIAYAALLEVWKNA